MKNEALDNFYSQKEIIIIRHMTYCEEAFSKAHEFWRLRNDS